MPIDAVQLENGFWEPWQARNLSTTIPHGFRMLEKYGALNNMRIAADREHLSQHKPDEFRGYVFQDSDLHKWLEAASLSLRSRPDAATQKQVQAIIALLAAAQFPDGYLDSYFALAKPNQQWTDLEWAHEMYCAGHLIEAGIARKRATGNTELLTIAQKFADHIDATFGEEKRAGLCGHPEIELALVELYRETADPRYLRLANYFIDQRGHHTFKGLGHIGPLYMQDRVPVREVQAVEGHAVRQLYLCAGVTDLYLETGEESLLKAMERLWHDVAAGKMYITGGIGARGYGEMFGDAYELPSKEAYCETCAAIALMMWNWRMLLATNDVRYADSIERVLYNGFLSGISFDGSHFFYENPLRSDGAAARQEWFACACCPPNVMRQLVLVGNYVATTNGRGVQIHQYMNGTITTERGNWRVETNYPWDGNIRIVCENGGVGELALRIPSWCENGQLTAGGTTLPVERGQYARVERQWKRGDVVELTLAVTPRFIRSHPYVDATRGSVAIERGPLIYCIEQTDQSADVNDLRVDVSQPLRAVWDGTICDGVMTLHAAGDAIDTHAWQPDLYRTVENSAAPARPTELTAIPYFAWGNRGTDKMRVWIPTKF